MNQFATNVRKTVQEFSARIKLLTALFLLASTVVSAQETTVSGSVTGEGGTPLSAVSVTVKGSSKGTSTNAAGRYTLTAAPNATLVFTYIGYTSQEVTIDARSEVNVTLAASNRELEQVVVIGYGTASKRDLTGSITKVSGKEVADRPNSNPVASLQGKVAGLSIINSANPGQSPDIRIRGTVSIGNVRPLYVVDGILQDNIDYLNPNDIESIEVLKDASSLAIFGVRGAAGVIAITTKRAKAGQVTVNFSTNYGFKKLVDKIKLADAEQFKTLFAEENANGGSTTPFDYTGLTANTDWIDAVTRTARFSNSNLSISGGSERNRFNFGLGYTLDEGIVRHQKLDRFTINLNDEFKVSKPLKIGVTLNVSRQNNPYGYTNNVLDDARKVVPMISAEPRTFRVRNPYGTDTINMEIYSDVNPALQTSGVVNPLVRLENEWDKTKSVEFRTVGSVFAEVAFLRNFTFRSTFYADMSNVNTRQYVPRYYSYNPGDNTPKLQSTVTRVQENDDTYRKFQQDYILNYKKNFGDHGLTATTGFTTYYSGVFTRQGTASQATGPTALPIPNDPRFWYISSPIFTDLGSSQASSGQSEFSTVSYLARALYNYKGRYYLNASFRDDASSRIPERNRHQQFWAVGAAWELSKEAFMQNQKTFSYVKLKGSVGVLGNQSATTLDGSPLNYPFFPNLTGGSRAVFGTNVFNAVQEAYFANPDLKWETVAAQEIGVELNAFRNRLHFEANYFNKTTNNLMTFVDRSSIGLRPKLENGGSIRNWGQEFTASWNQTVTKDFNVNIGGNITFLKSRVKSLSEDLPTGVLSRNFFNNGAAESRTQPGFPIGYFYGYVVEGVYQSYADVLKSPNAAAIASGGYGPGDLKYKDLNGRDANGNLTGMPDGKITEDDKTMIGNPTPDFTYGFSINANYKGFSLGIDFNGVYGNEVFRTWGALESPFQRVNYAADKINRWHGEGTSNWVPRLGQGQRINYLGSTYSIEDGSYLRVRNIQLGYSFNKSMLSRFNIRDFRLFFNVQNLKTWKNNSGYSPEFGGEAIAFGYDNASGALPVISTFGLNVTF